MVKRKIDLTHIRPIRGSGKPTLPVKGAKLFPELYASIFMAGKTGSGKTTVLAHLLRPKIKFDRRTTVVIFSSTTEIDNVMKTIIKRLKRAKIPVLEFSEIEEDGSNMLKCFLKVLEEESKTKEKSEDESKEEIPENARKSLCCFGDEDKKISEPTEEKSDAKIKENSKAKIKYKDIVPKYCVIIDDIGINETRGLAIADFLKKSRHYQCVPIILSQVIGAITPNAYNQLYYIYLFGGFSLDNLKTVHGRIQTHLTQQEFIELYREVTKDPHSFLNIQVRTGIMRKNFGKPLLL